LRIDLIARQRAIFAGRACGFGSIEDIKFERELSPRPSILNRQLKDYHRAHCKMEVAMDNDKANAKKFRDYATECRRMASNASGDDRAALLEIAEAWAVCAAEAERKGRGDRN
jgi:hypothetical protein